MHPQDLRIERLRRRQPAVESLEARDLLSSSLRNPPPASPPHRPAMPWRSRHSQHRPLQGLNPGGEPGPHRFSERLDR